MPELENKSIVKEILKRAVKKVKGKPRFSKNFISIEKPEEGAKVVEKKDESDTKQETGGVVLLRHIPHGFYEEQMLGFFKQFGHVTHLKLVRSKKTGRSRGFGFIQFRYREVAQVVAETMNNYLMFNRLLKAQIVPSIKCSWRKYTEDNCRTVVNRRKSLEVQNGEWSNSREEKCMKMRKRKLESIMNKLKSKGIEYDFKPQDMVESESKITDYETSVETPDKTANRTSDTTSVEAHKTPGKCLMKTSTESPAKSPKKSPVKSPMKTSLKSPMKSSLKTPMKSSLKTPMKSSLKTPMKTPGKSLMNTSMESPMKSPTKSPLKTPMKTPGKTLKKTPGKTLMNTPGTSLIKTSMESSTKSPTKSPTKSLMKSPGKSLIKTSMDSSTKSPMKTSLKTPMKASKKTLSKTPKNPSKLVAEIDESDDEIHFKTPPNTIKRKLKVKNEN